MGSRSRCLGSAVLWPQCDTRILLERLIIRGMCEGREGESRGGEPPPAGPVVPGPQLRVGSGRQEGPFLPLVPSQVPVCLNSNSLSQ